MKLSRPDLKALVNTYPIFTPKIDPKLIGFCSIDLPMDNKFYIVDASLFFQSNGNKRAIVYREKKNPVIYGKPIKSKLITLMPGAFILACTKHIISIPNTHVARVSGTSSLGRICVTAHITADRIDPGFNGKITLEIKNNDDIPVDIHVGDKTASLEFDKLSTPVDIGYSQKKDSAYSNQLGPVPFGGQNINWSKIRVQKSYVVR